MCIRDRARDYFVRLTGLLKNLNYSAESTPSYNNYMEQINSLVKSAPI